MTLGFRSHTNTTNVYKGIVMNNQDGTNKLTDNIYDGAITIKGGVHTKLGFNFLQNLDSGIITTPSPSPADCQTLMMSNQMMTPSQQAACLPQQQPRLALLLI
mmetsp:Transcript_25559/g.39337  ORF Transcript_25559/g.39337 Transcript_25559/m.39337 type:complete len:103 (-) Transcript_25559:37-345(-)|eukprot:CAMPEP_0170492120 /NCGR_PEP_ID=MMETSP0208-20121228/11714_1 /TAXON_ID=197538 /ORGANISM="Strombidium inclinatum, Strain S3" /LENGTH=102 /DNA_ID=CAMNT_0010767815 /DNA_START=10 /DNA_END=318 /DNA_ORIENTATION=-